MGFNSNKKDDIQFLIDLYLEFAKRTFQQRAEQYLTQVPGRLQGLVARHEY